MAHNRMALGATEEGRLHTLNAKILAALTRGPCTNAELSLISLDYGRRIRDLRSEHHWIERAKLEGGLNLYTLKAGMEPRWRVGAVVTLSDGQKFPLAIDVRATNEGLARNRAQHLFASVKIKASRAVP